MRFANPEWLFLLWLVPLLWGLAIWQSSRSEKVIRRALGAIMAPALVSHVSRPKRRLKLFLRGLALMFAIIALARPQMGSGSSEVKVRGVELMVALDVSTSMLAEDVKPSRLQFAKAELSRLLDMLSGDKVGLVGFAGSAVLLSPLTTDVSSLKMFLDSLSPYSVATQGTNFFRALSEAAEAFQRGGVEDDNEAKTTRVILILSDGEDQEKGALELARKLGESGTRIFTMAFGTARGGTIPVRDDRGFLRGYKKDKKGGEVVTQVKGEFLKELAKAGRGAFHFSTFGGNEAKLVKEDLDKLQKAEFASSVVTQYDEQFQWFLGAALSLLALEFLFSDVKGKSRTNLWVGRFEKRALGLLPFILFQVWSSQAQADSFQGILENNQAVHQFQKEELAEAKSGFTKALGDLTTRAEIHFNLGTAFLASKEPEKAIQEFDVALKMNPIDELKYKISFNKADAYVSLKRLPEALASYQEALGVKPDSREVKFNIELLIATSDKGDGDGDGKSDGKNQNKQDKPDKQDQDKKDQQNQQKQKDQEKQQKPQQPKPTPKPFSSDQLSKQDVSRILEELKRQEDQIRERMQREGGRDAPIGNDW